MPIAAIGAAVLADGVAAAAVADAGLTVASAFAVTAAVGATAGAIGVLTGNKTLTQIGTVLGVVGGVGALASSAGLFASDVTSDVSDLGAGADGTGSELADGTTGATASAASATPAADVTATGDVISPTQQLEQQTSQAAGAGVGSAQNIASGGDPNSVLGQALTPNAVSGTGPSNPLEAGDVSPSGLINTPASAAPGAATSSGASSLASTGIGSSAGTLTIGKADPLGGSLTLSPGFSAPSSGGVLSDITDFAKKNPIVSYGVLQSGGALVQGLFNPVTPAQIDALNAQAAANRAAASLSTTQQANMAAPLPVATRPGLINSPQATAAAQPVASASVTGVAA